MKARAKRAAELARAHWARLLFAAGLLAALFGNAGFRGLVANWLELRRLNGEIARLEGEERDLGVQLKALRTGDGPVERLARRDLGYIKKGEIEYRFPPPVKR